MRVAIEQVYRNKENLIIIGLTGRTGAGCSKTAEILGKEKISDLDLKEPKRYEFNNSDERKDKIIYDYISEPNRWRPFVTIEISGLILASALELGQDKLVEYIKGITEDNNNRKIDIEEKDKVISEILQMSYMFDECKRHSLNIDVGGMDDNQIESYYNFYSRDIKKYKERFRGVVDSHSCYQTYNDKLKGKQQSKFHLYTYLMQQFGNNVRCSGSPFDNAFKENCYMDFASRIDSLIKIIIKYNMVVKNGAPTRVCIDAIRNPYEAMYLKDKYRAFYLMAINTEDSDRRSRLRNLTSEELDNLDKIEYPSKMKQSQDVFYHQNIESCVEYAGIHIYNPNVSNEKYFELTRQLVRYITLIIHPGLITPSHIERCMQLAYNAKFNSGCLSRQVGAVVTREDFSVQAVGWNDVPKGQVPCALRDAALYCESKDEESFSNYEIEDDRISQALKKINTRVSGKLCGRCMTYCFKDIYNGLTGQKNQVYTRALHAEENAFLQISKYGGTGVKGGYLFSTASPCELCAKKAYQLGIKNIYYINPYPGISQRHILTFGKKNNPSINLFFGAIGQSFLDLYEPRIATKDEIELLTGIDVKKIISSDSEREELQYGDIEYSKVTVELKFTKGRNEIECYKAIEATVLKTEIKQFERKLVWTGSSYDGTEIVKDESDEGIQIVPITTTLPYRYQIIGNWKKGDKLKYKICTKAKDEKNIMQPYLAHMVKNKTEELELRIVCKKGEELLQKVKASTYADLNMNILVKQTDIEPDEKEDAIIYIFKITDANVNYTYAIDWEFKK